MDRYLQAEEVKLKKVENGISRERLDKIVENNYKLTEREKKDMKIFGKQLGKTSKKK